MGCDFILLNKGEKMKPEEKVEIIKIASYLEVLEDSINDSFKHQKKLAGDLVKNLFDLIYK